MRKGVTSASGQESNLAGFESRKRPEIFQLHIGLEVNPFYDFLSLNTEGERHCQNTTQCCCKQVHLANCFQLLPHCSLFWYSRLQWSPLFYVVAVHHLNAFIFQRVEPEVSVRFLDVCYMSRHLAFWSRFSWDIDDLFSVLWFVCSRMIMDWKRRLLSWSKFLPSKTRWVWVW